MKKLYFALLIIFISLIYSGKLLSQCYNCESLWMQDPKSPWKRTKGSIYDVSMVVKPVGKFYQVDLYMSYKSDPNYYNNSTDTFEVQHFFTLPDNVSFTDSWLWVDTTIMKADILERYSAFNIYEGIVNRRQDPSVLYKNSNGGFEFRIFPLPAKKFRKVKLSMMIPSNENDGFYLPLSIFKSSIPIPEIQVLVYGDDTHKIPVLSDGTTFETKVHATLGAYKLAKINASQVQAQAGIALSLVTETSAVSMAYGADDGQTGEGYYQLIFDPSTLLGVDTLNRRSLVFLIDHHSQTTLYTKAEVLTATKQMINRVVRPNDRFRILYNHFSIKEVSSTWIKGSEADLESIFAGIQLGSTSLLASGLYEAYNYVLDAEDGQVIVLSSDASKYQQLEAQQLKNELLEELGELRPTFILDYAAYNTHFHSTYYNGKYYYGNEVFYKILSSNTKGTYYTLANYNTTGRLNEGLGYLENELNEIYFDYLEFFVRPAQGVCYDNQVIKNGNRTVQVGRYKGSFPFEIEVLALYRDSFISGRQTIVDAEKVTNYKAVVQSHAMSKILNLENGPQSDNAIASIVETSLDHRVLSRYTAFLALEPGLQEPCLDCEDESDDTTVAVEDASEREIKLSAFPNPFVNEVKVVIAGVSSDSDIDSYAIYDATGRQRFINIELQKDSDSITLVIEGESLEAGLYLLKVSINGKVYLLKIMKI